jgi:F-type H+-transporting ATPase subunit epsilon
MAEQLMRLEVTTPEKHFYDGDVRMVELTTTEGDVGIYPKHIPMTMIVAPGILTITEADGTKKEAALMKGFLEITGESMSILAEVAEWPEEIDLKRAQKAEERAKKRLAQREKAIDMLRAEAALKRALIRQQLKK